MTVFLQMDGVDDYIKAPASLTFTRIVIDMNVKLKTGLQYFISSTSNASYIYKNPPVDNFGGFSTVTANGTTVTNGTNGIPINTRVTLEAITTARTEELHFFRRSTNIQFGKVDVYNIKIYNGASLIAHYDMNTGTVQDQSGNGNHATYLGTFLDDAKTYALSFDGVDDKLVLPSMTATEFILEMKPRPQTFEQYIAFNTNQPINRNGSNNADQINANYSAVYVDGVQATTNTPFIKVNTRQILRGVSSVTGTLSTYVYWNGNTSYMEGELYSLKIYNGATLQAEYDFTKGHVLDISGNSRNATLTGGTWLDDSPAPGYVDGSITLSLINNIYKDTVNQLNLVQSIFKDNQVLLNVNNAIYKDGQTILNLIQSIFDNSTTSISLDLKQVIYKDSTASLNLIQTIYKDLQTKLDLIEQMYKDNTINLDLILSIRNDIYIYKQVLETVFNISMNIDTEFNINKELHTTTLINREIKTTFNI